MSTARTKVVLVIPSSERVKVLRTAYSPPLGLLAIGASLLQATKNTDVLVLNGELYSTENALVEDIVAYKPNIVGISTNVGCYKTALSIAKKLKTQNRYLIVLGGPYVSTMWKECLKNRPYIDYCVVGDGEIPMVKLSNGVPPERIDGLAKRDFLGEPHLIPQIDLPLDSYPDPDWSLIDARVYQEAYRQTYKQADAISACINAMKGCRWQERSGGCIFCALLRSKLRQRSPERVWQEINRLYDKYGCNHFWELSDTIGCDIDWLRRFNSLKPNRPILFKGYLRASETTQESVKLLSTLGYNEVFIGIESGDNAILKAANKGSTVALNKRATILLRDAGIKTFASVVLGLPGESRQSLQATYDHVCDLFENGMNTLSVCIFAPYVGSRAFLRLLDDEKIGGQYRGSDVFDWPLFSRLWVQTQCICEWSDIAEYNKRLSSIPSSLYEDNFSYVEKEYDI
ncbi:MAG: Radical SAM domain protein [Berkelbacteria bacterium GW2011_GWA1_36_9]|uniref:Radical SAM domain protein n=1 Tax=Berkelbacteria bacterium GW2011_GWA1_36_9 TaxID=1618331 RepID=A0A0G0FC68_9BACT|nr:MAG: Radical SAM domain protein [Berkelbacteria bacterium GW2011_GWA1_36_9]